MEVKLKIYKFHPFEWYNKQITYDSMRVYSTSSVEELISKTKKRLCFTRIEVYNLEEYFNLRKNK